MPAAPLTLSAQCPLAEKARCQFPWYLPQLANSFNPHHVSLQFETRKPCFIRLAVGCVRAISISHGMTPAAIFGAKNRRPRINRSETAVNLACGAKGFRRSSQAISEAP